SLRYAPKLQFLFASVFEHFALSRQEHSRNHARMVSLGVNLLHASQVPEVPGMIHRAELKQTNLTVDVCSAHAGGQPVGLRTAALQGKGPKFNEAILGMGG